MQKKEKTMKKPLKILLASLLIISVSSCKNEKGSSQPGTDVENEATTDQTFEDLFKKMPGTAQADTTIKYTTMSAQAGESSLDVLTTELPSTCTAPPTTIAALNSGVDFFYHKFDSNTSAGATAMGFTGSIGRKEAVIIQDYVRYKTINCDGNQKKVGIGLRSYIHIKSFRGKIEGTLPQVAANVELGRAKASYSIKSLGFPIEGEILANGMGTQGEYTVENFSKLAVVHSNILRLLNTNSTMEIDPVLLPNN